MRRYKDNYLLTLDVPPGAISGERAQFYFDRSVGPDEYFLIEQQEGNTYLTPVEWRQTKYADLAGDGLWDLSDMNSPAWALIRLWTLSDIYDPHRLAAAFIALGAVNHPEAYRGLPPDLIPQLAGEIQGTTVAMQQSAADKDFLDYAEQGLEMGLNIGVGAMLAAGYGALAADVIAGGASFTGSAQAAEAAEALTVDDLTFNLDADFDMPGYGGDGGGIVYEPASVELADAIAADDFLELGDALDMLDDAADWPGELDTVTDLELPQADIPGYGGEGAPEMIYESASEEFITELGLPAPSTPTASIVDTLKQLSENKLVQKVFSDGAGLAYQYVKRELLGGGSALVPQRVAVPASQYASLPVRRPVPLTGAQVPLAALAEWARENPLPAAAAGAGLAWLVVLAIGGGAVAVTRRRPARRAQSRKGGVHATQTRIH